MSAHRHQRQAPDGETCAYRRPAPARWRRLQRTRHQTEDLSPEEALEELQEIRRQRGDVTDAELLAILHRMAQRGRHQGNERL